jgi:hypothetical protein
MGRKAAATAHGDSRHEWNAHQRGGWVTLWLWQGSRLSTRDVARLCGMTTQGAGKMMEILEQGLPITRVDGLWVWMEKE